MNLLRAVRESSAGGGGGGDTDEGGSEGGSEGGGGGGGRSDLPMVLVGDLPAAGGDRKMQAKHITFHRKHGMPYFDVATGVSDAPGGVCGVSGGAGAGSGGDGSGGGSGVERVLRWLCKEAATRAARGSGCSSGAC